MKILILHASAGAGHKRAAEALAKAFRSEDAGNHVLVHDILDFTPPIFRRTYAKGYLDIVRRVPELWGYMYSQSDKKALDPKRKKIRSVFNKLNTPMFFKFYDEFNPDIAICTHFMPLELLSTREKKGKIRTPLFCVVTDFAVHALWIMEGVTRYYVATEEARRHLIRKGQSPERVKLTGIPIDPVFSHAEPQEAMRRKLAIRKDLPTVLLLSGGFGVGPTSSLIRSLHELMTPCQLLVVAGANEKMKKDAEAAAAGLRIPVAVFGFVNNMHELMDASDLVISKPGGLTTSEVLAKGKPMIIIDPIPGQEQRNGEYLLEAGAAVRLFEVEDAPYKIQTLLSDKPRLARMQKNALALGTPRAAFDIAKDATGGH
jgi:processive 1,2-diacylglycerol beta-glucosyltransferase